MTMMQDFREVLTGNAALTALVPASAIVAGEYVQGRAYPFVTCEIVSGSEGITFAGPDGLFQGRVQVDCYSETYKATRDIAFAVVCALHGYTGGNFSGIFHVNEVGRREGGANEAERPYRVILDFEINWRTPT